MFTLFHKNYSNPKVTLLCLAFNIAAFKYLLTQVEFEMSCESFGFNSYHKKKVWTSYY